MMLPLGNLRFEMQIKA